MKKILETYLRIGKEVGIPQKDLLYTGKIIINPNDTTYFEVDIYGKERRGLTPNLELSLRLGKKKLNGKIPRLDALVQLSSFTLTLFHNEHDPLAVLIFLENKIKSADLDLDCWDEVEKYFEGLSAEDSIRKLLEYYKNGPPPEEYKDEK